MGYGYDAGRVTQRRPAPKGERGPSKEEGCQRARLTSVMMWEVSHPNPTHNRMRIHAQAHS